MGKEVSKQAFLSEKQKQFCNEYLVDLNATQAAIRAGYSEKTAQEQSSRLLSKVIVSQYIQKLMAEREKRVGRTADDVLRDIEAVKTDAMRSVPDRFGNMGMLDHGAALKALELEGKHRKMFTDKVEHSGGVEITKIERVIVDA